MNSAHIRFAVLIAVSLVVFYLMLRFVTRARAVRPASQLVVIVSAIVVVGGMVFAKFGHNAGLPWWIYYTVPALATLLVPPVAFRMTWRESTLYLLLAFASSPLIHVVFSFLLDWHEYMPFIPVPSLRSLL
jgi:hypothetical protein